VALGQPELLGLRARDLRRDRLVVLERQRDPDLEAEVHDTGHW